jgi:uncharacterized protein
MPNPHLAPIRIPVTRAVRWWDRLRGLLGRPALPPGRGLLIAPCRGIHTIGMRYSIDVAFLDGFGHVLALHRGLGRMRLAVCARSRAALEMPAGEIARRGLWVGCRVECVDLGVPR